MLWLDLETYNTVDIKVGTYRYAETAEVLLFAYAFDQGPVEVWDRAAGEPMPEDLREALHDDSVLLTAHHATFDRTIVRLSLGIDTKIERWRCTMVKAYSHALPGSLEACGVVLGLPKDKAKLAEGKKLVQRFCKPAPKNHKADRYDRHSHPAEWERFKQYAIADIVAMRELDKRIPDWNWREKDIALYHLDQRINDRGFLVDQELTAAGVRAAEAEKGRMEAEFLTLTKGLLERPTQRDRFCAYLNEHFGLGLDNTRAETFRELLKRDDLESDCRRLLELSIRFNKTSTAKYAALAPAVSSDGRFRGGLQFRGAARTRRWSGRNFQAQNLASRGLPPQRSIDLYIDALKADCHEFLFDDLMLYGSAALRGVIVAPEGRRLAVADLSNIEGRILAWLAGERWKIQAFFDYDAGHGPDLYNVTAVSIVGGDPYNAPKDIRNAMGKVPELAFGYAGGFGACQTFCRAYGIRLFDLWDTITANVDPELIASARANYTRWGADREPDADEDEWIASDVVKLAWRSRHPKTVQLWRACQDAARLAIQNPGRTYRAGPWLRFAMQRHAGIPYLLMRLPSGAFLVYSEPRYHEDDDAVTYMGIDATATGGQFGKWTRLYTYGGKFCIARGVPVLTVRGWVPIQDVQITDAVWDGCAWVTHSGVVCNGTARTVEAHGVRMTPDHEILTTEGWQRASQSEGHRRAQSWLPDRGEVRWQRWEEIPLAGPMRLREGDNAAGYGTPEDEETRDTSVLRMQERRDRIATAATARNVEAPGVRGLGLHARQMLSVFARRLGELWRTGNRRLRAVARLLRELLERHAEGLSAWYHVGACGQRQGLFAGELSLGDSLGAGRQPTHYVLHRHASGADVYLQGGADFQDRSFDACEPDRVRAPTRDVVRDSEQAEQVYDLTNCGPRQRFVVRDRWGAPLIVHNCENACQSLALDIMAANMPEIDASGFPIILSVHDELVTEPTNGGAGAELAQLMAQAPEWLPGFPLAAAGFDTARYRKD